MDEATEVLEKLEITDSSLNAVSNDFEEEEIPENLENEFSVVSYTNFDVVVYLSTIIIEFCSVLLIEF